MIFRKSYHEILLSYYKVILDKNIILYLDENIFNAKLNESVAYFFGLSSNKILRIPSCLYVNTKSTE